MDIVLVDDSIPFDGTTPLNQPLGGAEKAFASLPAALRRRGHEVRAFNRCRFEVRTNEVEWRTWQSPRPDACGVLVAYRKPELLDFVPKVRCRILWLAGPAGYLEREPNRALMAAHRDTKVVCLGETHRNTWSDDSARAVVIPPGIGRDFLEAEPMAPYHPPRAVVTTHPRMDLDWLLELWAEKVRPMARGAELYIYSAALARGAQGGEVPEELKRVFDQALAASADGVVVERPGSDPDMAAAYRAARVHLYPGSEHDVYGATLAESQATGLPAVARRLGAAGERIRDAETGFLVPDDEAFANCAAMLLTNDDVFWRRSAQARELQRSRSWDDAAAEFEKLWA